MVSDCLKHVARPVTRFTADPKGFAFRQRPAPFAECERLAGVDLDVCIHGVRSIRGLTVDPSRQSRLSGLRSPEWVGERCVRSPRLSFQLSQTLWSFADVAVTVSRVARRTEPQHGLGAALRELRLARGLSQEELAQRASLHPTWISHLESGRENPAWGTVRRLANALDVPLGTLAARAEHLSPE